MSELERFLQPIDEGKPAGEDLRLIAGDLTFGQLDELRREADPELDPGGESKNADWRGVAELCESALIEKTKDLELAAIYTQAQTSLLGLAGLETGLHLLTGMLQSFWANIFPGFDEGEVIQAIRARPLSWLGTSKDFLSVVRRVPLSDPIGGQSRSWFDYEQAQRVDQASTKSDQAAYQELIEAGYISIDDWHGSFNATPPERLAATLDGLRSCQTALRDLSTLCDELFTEGAPYFSDLANLLDEIQTMLEQFAGAGATPDTAVDTGVAAGVAGGAAPEQAGTAGPISSRDDAYRRLREVAEYLRKTEPHSPVPPLIDRAVRWGNMNFESLFNDVVKNQDVRSQTKELLGLEEPPA